MKRLKEGIESIIPLSVDFVKVIPTGQTLQAGSNVTITDSLDVDKTSEMLVESALDSTKMVATIQGGEVGKHYRVLFTAITEDFKWEKAVELEVVAVQ
jgi:hypothetical protein